MTFCSHQPQILNFPPIFTISIHFPPISRKLFFPHFSKFSSLFSQNLCFLHTLCVFCFPPSLTMMHLCITQCMYWTPLTMCPLSMASINFGSFCTCNVLIQDMAVWVKVIAMTCTVYESIHLLCILLSLLLCMSSIIQKVPPHCKYFLQHCQIILWDINKRQFLYTAVL